MHPSTSSTAAARRSPKRQRQRPRGVYRGRPLQLQQQPPASTAAAPSSAPSPMRAWPGQWWLARAVIGHGCRTKRANVYHGETRARRPAGVDDEQPPCPPSSSPSCDHYYYPKRRKLSLGSDEDSLTDDDATLYDAHTPAIHPTTSKLCELKIIDPDTAMESADDDESALPGSRETCDYADWEALSARYTAAADAYYQDDDIAASARAVRAVLDGCARFLRHYRDPSVLFGGGGSGSDSPPEKRSPETLTPPEERLRRDWGQEPEAKNARRDSPSPTSARAARQPLSAFHAVLGGALALYGSLLARDPAVVPASEEADEPRDPTAYWLAALDVFETGDALPPASGGDTSRPAQDWRLAIAWGHTLVSLASHRLSQPSPPSPSSPSGPPSSPRPYSHRTERGLMPQPSCPPGSLLGMIAARRPSSTFARRGSLSQTSTNELLTLAADQYSRGIMHMPRPKRAARTSYFSPVSTPFGSPPVSPGAGAVSTPLSNISGVTGRSDVTIDVEAEYAVARMRTRQLMRIAEGVVGVAERMEERGERRYWARWADGMLSQVRFPVRALDEAAGGGEAEDEAAEKAEVEGFRGRCWLAVGKALGEGSEGEGDPERQMRERESRMALERAVSLLEQALSGGSRRRREVSGWLVEALQALAEVAPSEEERGRIMERAFGVERQGLGLDERARKEEAMDET